MLKPSAKEAAPSDVCPVFHRRTSVSLVAEPQLFTIFLYFRTTLVDLMFRGDIFSSQVTDGVAPAAGVVVYPDHT